VLLTPTRNSIDLVGDEYETTLHFVRLHGLDTFRQIRLRLANGSAPVDGTRYGP